MPDIPIWEIALRSFTVFITIIVILRIAGKRDIGEMSPADLVLLLLLSANVHTSLAGDDKSLLGGIIGAIVLMITNYLLNHFAYKNKKFEKILKGHPEVIISQGKVIQKIANKHKLSPEQLMLAIRKEGAEKVSQIRLAIIEIDGTISIFKSQNAP